MSSAPRRNIALYVVLGVLILAAFWAFSSYNSLVAARESVNGGWAQVEAQYQRRFDLIPNLVSTVKGAANFEQQTLTQVTEARTKWLSAGSREERIAATGTLDSALSRLLVTVESYPQLRATEAFRDLQVQLEGTENRIQVARQDYNDIVQGYNARVKTFPTNIFAGMFGFGPEEFFEATPGSENAPSVDFGTTSSQVPAASAAASL